MLSSGLMQGQISSPQSCPPNPIPSQSGHSSNTQSSQSKSLKAYIFISCCPVPLHLQYLGCCIKPSDILGNPSLHFCLITNIGFIVRYLSLVYDKLHKNMNPNILIV